MAISSRLITVTASATLISIVQSDRAPGASLAVRVPAGGVTVFVGGTDVAASGATQGWPVAAGEQLYLDLDTPGGYTSAVEEVWAVTAAGSQPVNALGRGI